MISHGLTYVVNVEDFLGHTMTYKAISLTRYQDES